MKPGPRDLLELVLLAAIWGASFLFMRMGASDFGPAGTAFLRGAGACALLLPLAGLRGEGASLRPKLGAALLVGVTNSALPFMAYAYASQALNAGLSALFNATTPLWGATIAWLWLKERLDGPQALGLAIGFAGVAFLALEQAGLKSGEQAVPPGLAALACIVATLLYGFSASFTRRYLQGVPSMSLAAGSQLGTALVLAVPAWAQWPDAPIASSSWWFMLALSLVCTGVAYILYFRLLARIGTTATMSVTYLIPMFAMSWGALFLDEAIGTSQLVAGALILLGTALTTGLVGKHPSR